MPQNKDFALQPAFIEMLHDEMVSLTWPGIEPEGPGPLRDPGLLDSAAGRPFQSVDGADAYESILEKGSALFHSLIANRPFQNGNKRTAVLALVSFLMANEYYPALTNSEMLDFARLTATYQVRGITHSGILSQIVSFLVDGTTHFKVLAQAEDLATVHQRAMRIGRGIREHPLNRVQPRQ